MLAGMIVGATLVIALLLLSSLRNLEATEGRGIRIVAVAGIAIGGIAAALAFGIDRTEIAAPESFGSSDISWADVERVTSNLREPGPAAGTAMQAASIPSLLRGLEQRLEAEPGDAPGWALLAQSYAFVGQAERAEQALGRAIDLGFDEGELRQRVASATRDPHADLPEFATSLE
jgi:hypothetical protein